MWFIYNFSASKLLKSALASALLSKCNKYSADLAGQRPWVHLWALHWALRPTPPLKRLNGTISFFAITFFKNCWALLSGMPVMALAVSRVFCDGIRIVEVRSWFNLCKLCRYNHGDVCMGRESYLKVHTNVRSSGFASYCHDEKLEGNKLVWNVFGEHKKMNSLPANTYTCLRWQDSWNIFPF